MISAISLRSALADRPVSDLHLSEWLRRTESPGRRWLAPSLSLSLCTIYGPPPSHLDHSHPPTKAPNHYILLSKKQDQLHNSPGFLGLSFPLMAHTLGDTLKNKQMAMLSLNHTQKWLWHVFFFTNRPCALHSMYRSGAPYSRCQYPSLFYQS